MPAIVVRLLLVMFLTQHANVRWDGKFSAIFSLRNGSKQGAVLSAIAYCVYVNGLFEELRKNRSGCWVGQSFLGILGYSDDNILLAPSIDALQTMLDICEKYAARHGLKFSTDRNPTKSKTRCLAFLQKERDLRPVLLCGNQLPWTASCKHLGNTIVTKDLAENGDIRSQDVKNKRATFINKTNELIQEFHFAHPRTVACINMLQNSHFYGSVLWKHGSKYVEMLEKSWNVAIRRIFALPLTTHRYLIEPISNQKHARTMMNMRFLSFIQSIRNSKKFCLRNLLRSVEHDTRSVTGNNLRRLMLESGTFDIRNLRPKDAEIGYFCVPEKEEYRIEFIKELIEVKNNELEVIGFDNQELDDILSYLCVS